jgi:glyoxylase-like metal-dependent hydrolase (beta-lactamase superfamily II)
VAPGIRVVRTPGHTDEDASLVVETDHGSYVLTHLWAFADIKPGEDDSEHKKKMLQIADWIIPGHGPKVRNPLKKEEQ